MVGDGLSILQSRRPTVYAMVTLGKQGVSRNLSKSDSVKWFRP
jgi:hypothetical protein